MSSYITVKVGKVPSSTGMTELTLADGATAGDAIREANISTAGYQIRVDGEVGSASTRLTNGSRVTLTKQIKGNAGFIEVNISKVPGTVRTVTLNGARTVRAAATEAGLTVTGFQPRVNGDNATLDTAVRNGDRIVFTKQIKGNS